jgi:hypothetical protein
MSDTRGGMPGVGGSDLTGRGNATTNMTMAAFVESDLMSTLVGEKKAEYYRKKFRIIIEASGLQDASLADVTWKDLSSSRNRRAIGIKPFLPFTARSLYNWPAFFFTFFWGVWRGVYLKWYLLGAFLILNVLDTLVEMRTGFSFILKGGGIGISVAMAIYGNFFLLYQLIKEARTGVVRLNPTSQKDLWIAILVAVVLLGIEIVIFD